MVKHKRRHAAIEMHFNMHRRAHSYNLWQGMSSTLLTDQRLQLRSSLAFYNQQTFEAKQQTLLVKQKTSDTGITRVDTTGKPLDHAEKVTSAREQSASKDTAPAAAQQGRTMPTSSSTFCDQRAPEVNQQILRANQKTSNTAIKWVAVTGKQLDHADKDTPAREPDADAPRPANHEQHGHKDHVLETASPAEVALPLTDGEWCARNGGKLAAQRQDGRVPGSASA